MQTIDFPGKNLQRVNTSLFWPTVQSQRKRFYHDDNVSLFCYSSNLKLQESACAHNTGLDVDVNFDASIERRSVQISYRQKFFDVVDAIHFGVTCRILCLVYAIASDADLSSKIWHISNCL